MHPMLKSESEVKSKSEGKREKGSGFILQDEYFGVYYVWVGC